MVAKNKSMGFTLIELMITVAIIGVLGAIAYPSYQDSVRKSRRAEGRSAMMEVLQQQERYMTQKNTYLVFNADATGTPFNIYVGSSSSPSYKLSARKCKDSADNDISERVCIQIVATPTGSDTKAGSLQMTSTGTKTCTGSAADSTTKTSPLCWP